MKRVLFLFLVAPCLAVNAVRIYGPSVYETLSPEPLDISDQYVEFYWDDGEIFGGQGWCWYTGGNYWAVQFDEEKTGGEVGNVSAIGSQTYTTWPNPIYEGVYLHIFNDVGGQPGDDIYSEYFQHSTGHVWEWLIIDPHPTTETGVFYIAWEQIGDYPDCDAIGADYGDSGHNWTCYYGNWEQTDFLNSDYLLRCYWGVDAPLVVETTWGQVKALY